MHNILEQTCPMKCYIYTNQVLKVLDTFVQILIKLMFDINKFSTNRL